MHMPFVGFAVFEARLLLQTMSINIVSKMDPKESRNIQGTTKTVGLLSVYRTFKTVFLSISSHLPKISPRKDEKAKWHNQAP